MTFKLFFFTIFCLLFSTGRASTNYIHYKQDCDLAYRLAIDDTQYRQSVEYLETIEKKYDGLFTEEYVLMAYCFKKLGRETRSAKCLKKAWSTYPFDLNCLMHIDAIQPNKIMEGFSKRQKKIVYKGYDNFSKLKSDITDSLITVFDALVARDQRPRVDSTLADQIYCADSLNMIEFKNIVYKYGFPGEWLLPGKSSITVILLTHSSYYQDFFDEMKPVFLNEVREGRMPPSYYLFWIDRHNQMFGLPREFGMLNLKQERELTEAEKKVIVENRLRYGLVSAFPIPSTMLTFYE